MQVRLYTGLYDPWINYYNLLMNYQIIYIQQWPLSAFKQVQMLPSFKLCTSQSFYSYFSIWFVMKNRKQLSIAMSRVIQHFLHDLDIVQCLINSFNLHL
jgi:hypothetical protein